MSVCVFVWVLSSDSEMQNSTEVGEDVLCFTQSGMICGRAKEGKEFCVLMVHNNVFKSIYY